MRWGCCAGVEQAQACKDAGFEYLEVNVQGVLRGQDDDATWAAGAPDVDALPLPLEAANCLLPAALPVAGSSIDEAALRQYMQRVARRAKQVGIQRLVFGSGGARKRPQDVTPADAARSIQRFATLAAELCHAQGVTVVIEHLNQKETNTLNALSDCLALQQAVNHPGLAMLVDSYHYGLEHEQTPALLALGKTLHHVHVAEVQDRIEPGGHAAAGMPEKSFDFVSFFRALKQIGYDERISFEGKWSRPFEQAAPATLAYLRSAWAQA